jgi:hypothetical protein
MDGPFEQITNAAHRQGTSKSSQRFIQHWELENVVFLEGIALAEYHIMIRELLKGVINGISKTIMLRFQAV